MAFSFQNGGNGKRGRRFHGTGTLSEMNVVPLVDVVLVLLIIFMLTAHVMEFGLEVEVPQVRQVRSSAEELPVITISRDGELFLNEKPANINSLGAEVRQRFAGAGAVYVRADKKNSYGAVMELLSRVGEGGYQRVSLLSQPSAAKRSASAED